MGNWASYIIRRESDGPLAGAVDDSVSAPGWICWELEFAAPAELARVAGAGPAVLVSEADSGMAAVTGIAETRTAWLWIFNERAYYGDGYHGDAPTPDPAELEASRPERARATATSISRWAEQAGLPIPDPDALVKALLAEDIFAMRCVYDLCVLLRIRSVAL
jgi:hypothetical protein